MAENWQDLVPFYVAGLLSPEDKAAFEHFLHTSDEGRKAVEEWREIAKGVWEETESRSRRLPTLSAAVRAQLNAPPNGHKPHHALEMTLPMYSAPRAHYAEAAQKRVNPQKERSASLLPIVSLSLAAALLMVCLAGMIFMALGQDDPDHGAPPDVLTETAAAITPSPRPTLTTMPLQLGTPTSNPIIEPTNPTRADRTLLPMITPTPAWVASPTPLPSAAPNDDHIQHTFDLQPGSPAYFTEMMSIPSGDAEDQIWVRQMQNISYEFRISMSCIGDNTEALRWNWGTSQDAQFRCGESTTSIMQMADQYLYVSFAPGSEASRVIYSLVVQGVNDVPTPTPTLPSTAPDDIEPHPVEVEPGVVSMVAEAVSSVGDTADILLVHTNALVTAPITYTVSLDCGTYTGSALIWAMEGDPAQYTCGSATNVVLFTPTASQSSITIAIPVGTESLFVGYTLTLTPWSETTMEPAPSDSEPKDFLVTKGFNSFTERVSAPNGDTIDRIHMTITDIQPGEWRDLDITLTCSGVGTHNLIWVTLVGEKTNGCGATLHAGFSAENSQISFDVKFPDNLSEYSSIEYVLEVHEQ